MAYVAGTGVHMVDRPTAPSSLASVLGFLGPALTTAGMATGQWLDQRAPKPQFNSSGQMLVGQQPGQTGGGYAVNMPQTFDQRNNPGNALVSPMALMLSNSFGL